MATQSSLHVDQPLPDGRQNRLHAAGHTAFVRKPAHVDSQGVRADVERFAHLAMTAPLSQKCENLPLPCRWFRAEYTAAGTTEAEPQFTLRLKGGSYSSRRTEPDDRYAVSDRSVNTTG